MKKMLFPLAAVTAAAFIFLVNAPHALSQAQGVPVKITVTAEPAHGEETLAVIPQADVSAYQNNKPVTVARWVPARGPNSALELFLLIDDSSSSYLGTQLADTRQFIDSQPATTLTGVAYMQNGIARVLQSPTTDHAAAAKTLRLPLGRITAGASPYLSLSDLIKRWPASSARREVVMISSGIDPLGGPPPVDAYLETATGNAQRAGIVVYTIYTPHVGHFGRSFFEVNWGQNYLSELSEDTGGDMFGFGNIPPVSFAPYFKEIVNRLANQYVTTLNLVPGSKSGFESIRVMTKEPNTDLVTQTRAYVQLGG